MRIPSSAGTRDPERSRFFHKLSRLVDQVKQSVYTRIFAAMRYRMRDPTMGGAADPRFQQRGLTDKNSRGQALPGHKNTAYKIVAAQALVTVVLALLLLGISGGRSAYSALAGGLVSVFSNFYLAAKLFRFERGAAPGSIVRAFYIGEAVKILITAASFVVIFAVLDTEALYVLLTYGATLLVYWFALIATPSK